jgi:hypothetical protein
MKASEFRKLIREEVSKVLNEGNLSTAIVQLLFTKLPYNQQKMPYPKFLELLKKDGLKSLMDSRAKTIDIPLYDYGTDQSLVPQFKNIQRDLFAAGYKWLDGSQEIQKAGGRGGNLNIGINPKAKTIDMYRD